MPKPSSNAAVHQRQQTTPAQAEKLVQQLADKLYGYPKESPVQTEQKAQPLSISLPPAMIEKLQDEAIKNKRRGDGRKTVSGIVRQLLEQAGY